MNFYGEFAQDEDKKKKPSQIAQEKAKQGMKFYGEFEQYKTNRTISTKPTQAQEQIKQEEPKKQGLLENIKGNVKSIIDFGTELGRGIKTGIPQATSAIKKTGSDILGLISKGEKKSAGTVFDPFKIRGELAPKLSDSAEKLRQSAISDFKKSNLLNAELPIIDNGSFIKNIQDPKWLGRNIGQSLPNLATSLGVSTITTALTANPAVGLAVGFGTSYSLESGFAYMDAKEAGVDEEKANKVALITGVANAVLDSLPIGRILGKLGKAPLVRKSITREIVSGILKQTALESTTEGLQEIVSNAVARSYDKNREWYAGVPESLLLGGVLGGASSVAIEAPMDILHKNSAKVVEDLNNAVKMVEAKPEEQRTQTEKDLLSAVKGEVTFKPITTQDRVLPEIPTEQVKVEVSRAKQSEGELTPAEWKGKEIVHVGNRTVEQAKTEGLHVARNPQKQFGKAVYFEETTEAVSDFGTNVQAKINTDDFNLKVFNSVKERTDFLEEQNVDNLADGIRKEGTYDGFIVTNPDPEVGNYYGITNLDKVNEIVTGKKIMKALTIGKEVKLLENKKLQEETQGEGFVMTEKADKNKIEVSKKINDYRYAMEKFNAKPTETNRERFEKIRSELAILKEKGYVEQKPQGQTQPTTEVISPQKTAGTEGGARVVAPTTETITKEVPREQLPVGGGKEKVSRLEARVKDVLGKATQEQIDRLGLSTYEQMNKKENIKSASEYVVNNQEEAIQVLSGEKEAPKGILRNSIYVAMENLAKGDVGLARKLASLQSTRYGQELSILTEIDPDSPVRAISEVINIRAKEFERRNKGKTIASEKKRVAKQIQSEVKAPSKDNWISFIESISC